MQIVADIRVCFLIILSLDDNDLLRYTFDIIEAFSEHLGVSSFDEGQALQPLPKEDAIQCW